MIARPPQLWVDLGLVKPGTLWTVKTAVYGLREPPRIWGGSRDAKLREAKWRADGGAWRLNQCATDSQVWTVQKDGDATLHGLVIVYVDDLLFLMPDDGVKTGLQSHLRTIWEMKASASLAPGKPVCFIGLELERDQSGDLKIHQRTFIKQLLARYGHEAGKSKGISAITMELPDPTKERAPTAAELKKLQTAAGELNWLATRTRADLAYYASVLASSSTRFAEWSVQLWTKVLRYLVNTASDGLVYRRDGSESQLTCWSDAGYGGEGARAQSGVLIAWGGSVTVWRSSRGTLAHSQPAERRSQQRHCRSRW